MILDCIKNFENYRGLEKIYTALEFLAKTDFSDMPEGRYELEDGNYYMVQSYEPHSDGKLAEAHKQYIDIQFMVRGAELIGVAQMEETSAPVSRHGEDCWFYEVPTEILTLSEGRFAVLYPNDLHAPGISDGCCVACKKIVVKVRA